MTADKATTSYQKLTPDQFKAAIKTKGWTQDQVAALFGKSRVWLNTISSNPERPAHYDFAIMGLPSKRTFSRDIRLLKERLDGWVSQKPAPQRRITKLGPEYRYREYLTTGSIVTASDDVGSMAEAGARGIVFQVIDQGSGVGDKYGVIFESGAYDWFRPEDVDTYLASSGLADTNFVDYKFANESHLIANFNAGNFTFWP